MNEKLKTDVFEALGTASMCWSETPKGVFDSTLASKVGDELLEKINNNIPAAMDIVVNALNTDEGYRQGWKANIAMAFKDAFIRHATHREVYEIANIAADDFLTQLCKPKED